MSAPRGANVDHVKPKQTPPSETSRKSSQPEESTASASGPSLRVVLETKPESERPRSISSPRNGADANDDLVLSDLPLLAGAGIISLDELVPDLETFSENFPKIPEKLIFDAKRSQRRKMNRDGGYPRDPMTPPSLRPFNRNTGYNAPMFPSRDQGVPRQNGFGNQTSAGGSRWSTQSTPDPFDDDPRNTYRKAGIRNLSLPDVVSGPRRMPFFPGYSQSPMFQTNAPRSEQGTGNASEGKSLKEALAAFEWMLDPVKPPIANPLQPSFNGSAAHAPWASPYLRNQINLPSGIPAPYGPPRSGTYGYGRGFNGRGGSYKGSGAPSRAFSGYGHQRSPYGASGNAGYAHGYDQPNSHPRPGGTTPTYQSKPLLDAAQIENSTIFDQPPIPIDVGMRFAEVSHRKVRIAIIVVVIVVLLIAAFFGMGIIGSGGEEGEQGASDVPTEQGSTSASVSSSASASATGGGTVVYQYSADTASGKKYNVQETATFNDEGYCEFTTMKMQFPDAATAKEFTDSLLRDYGNRITIDSLDGADATVTIEVAAQQLDREKYENSLRYSVDDLVVLKK